NACPVLNEAVLHQLPAPRNGDAATQPDPLPARGQVAQKRGQLVHTDTSDHLPQGESKPIDQINGTQCPSSPIRVVVTCCMPILLDRKCTHSVPLEGQSSTLYSARSIHALIQALLPSTSIANLVPVLSEAFHLTHLLQPVQPPQDRLLGQPRFDLDLRTA